MAVSIHALNEEGDLVTASVISCGDMFQSTPSMKRATSIVPVCHQPFAVSIHALNEEGDHVSSCANFAVDTCFNPRPQ